MTYPGSPWDYEVRIALPPSYGKSQKSYPVLWVTDGSFLFEEAVGTVFTAGPEMIVVSVGVPLEERADVATRRKYDFTATDRDLCSYSGPGGVWLKKECNQLVNTTRPIPPLNQTGGAAKFLAFMTSDVRRRIAENYRVSGDNTLFGYSAGGTFCLYALLTHPGDYQNYICGSPALLTEDAVLFQIEQDYATAHKDLKAKLLISAGDGEIFSEGAWGIVSGATRMAEILHLRGYPGLELHVRSFPGNLHDGPGRVSSLYWGLKTLLLPN